MQPLSWYINRLSLMSPGEVLWRTSRVAGDRLASLRGVGAVPEPDLGAIALPPWAAPGAADASRYVSTAERVLAGEVEIFGTWEPVGTPEIDWNRDPRSGVRAPLVPGSRLNYRDSRQAGCARTTWEVNRHLQLVVLGQAWSLTRDPRYRDAARLMLDSWIRACPYPLGINWNSALEHGIRLINWYLAARLFALSRADLVSRRAWVESIHRHCAFIWKHQSRYSSANNHLIGEMAGLYVASVAWPCWKESARWRSRARAVLEREAERQVHADGVTREQTVSYQVFVLQFLVIAGLVGEAAGEPFPRRYWSVVRNMLTFLHSIRDASGNLPGFGDSDEGVVFSLSPHGRDGRADELLDLAQMWSAQGATPQADTAGAWLAAGFPAPSQWPTEPLPRVRSFADGGYHVLGGDFGTDREVSVVLDAGPLGYLSIAAHGHADCLSFVLSLGGEPILVDPGTYCYHGDPLWRSYFRSTPAHNTLCVDGVDQSAMAGPFMWTRKARPTLELFDVGGEVQRVRAHHDGYRSLDDPLTHTRELRLHLSRSELEVVDEIDARERHELRRYWHFAPECEVRIVSDTAVEVRAPSWLLRLRVDEGAQLLLYRGSREPVAGWLSPRFAELRETFTLCVVDHSTGRRTLRTQMRWRRL